MKKLLLILVGLSIASHSFAQSSKTKIPDDAKIYILIPEGTGQTTKEALEKKHSWHVVSDRSKAEYVVKVNMHHVGVHKYATADIYKGSDIIGSTSSVRGGIFASKKRVIAKLVRKRF